jgi:hypothetical protein
LKRQVSAEWKKNAKWVHSKFRPLTTLCFHLFSRSGGSELTADDVVWARLKRQIFLPAAVLHADAKFATVAVFDASKPLNQHKLRRNQIIPAFSDDLNNELTVKI